MIFLKKVLSVALALTFAFSASAFAESRTSGTHHGTHVTSHGKTAKIKSTKAKRMRIKSTAKGMRTKSMKTKGVRIKGTTPALPKTGLGGTNNE